MSPPLRLLRLSDTAVLNDDETGLIRRAQDGDDEAFARLHNRYRRHLLTFCTQRLGDPGLAEDVVQETFFRAYRALPRFKSEKQILPWLTTIALRRCATAYGSQAKQNTNAFDPHDDLFLERQTTKEPFDEVAANERRRRIERALRTLPPRQRRALLLYAIEDWSYVDIASAEGASISTVKSLIWRARDCLRKAYEAGLLGTVFLPVRRLAGRLSARFRAGDGPAPVVLTAIGAQHVASMLVALSLLIGGASMPAESIQKVAAIESETPRTARAVAAGAPARKTLASEPARPEGVDLSRWKDRGSPHKAYGVDALFTQDQQHPDSVHTTSMVASPAYDRDHTLLMTGGCYGTWHCRSLFASHDGGANWTRLPARGYFGETLLLPPDYPADDRIFAMGDMAGLQVSEDGGKSFRVASPLIGHAAMSPAFNAGDPRILILTSGELFEYRADIGATVRSKIVPPPGQYGNLVLSPTYPTDETVFFTGRDSSDLVAGRRYTANWYAKQLAGSQPLLNSDGDAPMYEDFHQCREGTCEQWKLPGGENVFSVWFSPRFRDDRTVYLARAQSVIAIRDGRVTSIPTPAGVFLSAFAFSPPSKPSEFPTVWAAGYRESWQREKGPSSGLYRSDDGGKHWLDLHFEDVGFLYRTPSGRLIADTGGFGLACSEDDGLTWAPRCSPE